MSEKMKKEITDDTCKLYIGGINVSWSSDRIKGILEDRSGCKVMRVDVVKNFAFAVRGFHSFKKSSIRKLIIMAKLFFENYFSGMITPFLSGVLLQKKKALNKIKES